MSDDAGALPQPRLEPLIDGGTYLLTVTFTPTNSGSNTLALNWAACEPGEETCRGQPPIPLVGVGVAAASDGGPKDGG